MKNTISFDEAGNTGQDLLNKDQKVFVLASVRFDSLEVEILSNIFNTSREFHFKNLKNSKIGRAKIIEFINHDLITEDNVVCSVCNKEYVAVAQIVDQLIEPVFYGLGFDLYKHGLNLSFTNSIYYFGKYFWNKELFLNFLKFFVAMIRNKNDESIIKFYKVAKELYLSGDEDHYKVLVPVLESRTHIVEIMKAVTKYTLDVTLSSFMVLCDKWHKKINTKIIAYFDNSKQMDYYQDIVSFCRSLPIKNTEVGFGSRKITFPSQIEKLELVDSSNYLSVQCADIVASTFAFAYNNQNSKYATFVESIKKSKLFNLTDFHIIWPEPRITAEDLDMVNDNGINILDFLAEKRIEHENSNIK